MAIDIQSSQVSELIRSFSDIPRCALGQNPDPCVRSTNRGAFNKPEEAVADDGAVGAGWSKCALVVRGNDVEHELRK